SKRDWSSDVCSSDLVLGEWLRTWLFTGFPWLLLGSSQVDSPLAAWAPIGGVYLLSLIVVLSGTLGVEFLRRRWWTAFPVAVVWRSEERRVGERGGLG